LLTRAVLFSHERAQKWLPILVTSSRSCSDFLREMRAEFTDDWRASL